MAYSRRKTVRTRRSSSRSNYASRRTVRTAGRRRTTGRRGGGRSAGRTIRLVIETAAANPVQRPLGMTVARPPRQPAFQ